MFRNKVLVRAAAGSSSEQLPPFLLRQLSLPAAVPVPALDLEILCSRISCHYRLACLPQAPADALLVYQRCQSNEAAAAVSEVTAAFPGASVGEVEELACSGELVAKAVGCGLRTLMLEHGWRCLGESIYAFSTFAESEERTDLCALNVDVQLGGNGDFEFVVSPDAFRFATHKISDAASCHMMETFHPKKDLVFDNWNSVTACTTLPALQEGHVIAWNFFGQNQLAIKEQLLLNCATTQPTWDKPERNLTSYTAKTNDPKDQSFVTNFVVTDPCLALEFRTPKPAMLSTSSVKSLDSKGHKIDCSVTSPIKFDCQSKSPVFNNSCESQVTLFKPSFSRYKPADKRKMRYSLEHGDVDNSNKSSHIDAATSLSNSVSSSSASLPMQVTQVPENHKREHAELSNTSCQGGGGTARVLQDYLDKENMDTRRKSKDSIPGIPEVNKAIPGSEKNVLSTKVIINKKSKFVITKNGVAAAAKAKAKEDLGKEELTSMTNQKTVSEVSKYESSGKVRDHQNDELNRKVKKAKTEPVNKDSIANDDLMAKVVDHHKHGKLRLLTVAELKFFLGARKAKVGGTKEVLVQRVTELLG